MKIIRSSLIYVVLGFLPVSVNFLLSPLYSHALTPENNALIGQAMIFQGFLMVFLNLGIESAFARLYFDYYKDEKKLKEFTSSILIFIFLSSSFIFILMNFFGDALLIFFQKNQSFNFSKYGVWVFGTTFCMALQSVFLFYYRNSEKVGMYAVLSLLFFLTSVAFTLTGILYFKAGALGSIAGRGIAYILVTAVFVVLFFRKMGFSFKFKYIKESLRFALPIVPYQFLMVLYINIDRILIERYFSFTDLGIYNFAFLISGAVSVFISSGQNVLGPLIYPMLQEEVVDEKKVNSYFRYFHFIGTTLICFGLAVAIIFIQLFISSQYHSILNYIGVLFLAYIFRVYYVIYIDGLFFYKKTRWMSLITLGSFLVGLLSNLLLIPAFGILGVCISVVVINLVQALGAYLQLHLYKINKNFYHMGLNHVYTLLIIGLYFFALFSLRMADGNVIFANYVPLCIAVLFSIYMVYKNQDILKEYIRNFFGSKIKANAR